LVASIRRVQPSLAYGSGRKRRAKHPARQIPALLAAHDMVPLAENDQPA